MSEYVDYRRRVQEIRRAGYTIVPFRMKSQNAKNESRKAGVPNTSGAVPCSPMEDTSI